MKKAIIAAILIIAVVTNVKSQIADSIGLSFDTSHYIIFKDFKPIDSFITSFQRNHYVQLDTVPVVMLVCDTAIEIEDTAHFNALPEYWKEMYKIARKNPWAFWKVGYSVRQEITMHDSYGVVYGNIEPLKYPKHLFYLDDKKQMLQPNIVVWQSIER